MTPDPLTILAIDPSSTCSGYAVLRAGRLIEAGVIRPRQSAPANDRIRETAVELAGLRCQYDPDVIVIEDTSGKVGARHKGGGAGLAVYGKAVGWVACEAEAWAMSLISPRQVVLVRENDWSGGTPKSQRLRRVAAEFSIYDPASDPGGDCGDAIALAVWYEAESSYRAAVEDALRKQGRKENPRA